MENQHPFVGHKQYFANISLEERPNWTKKMLETPQKKGQYPIYKAPYPNQEKWKYQGYNLNYYFSEKHGKDPKAILFYFHGLNSYGGSSGFFGTNIAENCEMNVYAIDFRNFGSSEGDERGFIASFQSMVKQAQEFVDFIIQKYDNKKPIFLSGLSLGGSICFKMSLNNSQKYAGVIFLSPALKENKQAQPFMKKVGKFIGTHFPKLKLIGQTFNSQSKFDQSERIEKDELIYKDKVVPGSIKVVLEAMQEIEKEWKKFKNNFIMIQSGVDKMVDPFLAIDFEKECSSEDKTVIYCKQMWHAVFGEDELPAIVKIVSKWLNTRIK